VPTVLDLEKKEELKFNTRKEDSILLHSLRRPTLFWLEPQPPVSMSHSTFHAYFDASAPYVFLSFTPQHVCVPLPFSLHAIFSNIPPYTSVQDSITNLHPLPSFTLKQHTLIYTS